MVGVCGVVGRHAPDAERLVRGMTFTDSETTVRYRDERMDVRSVTHAASDRRSAETTGGDAAVLLWGTVYGYESGDGYVPRRESHPNRSAAAYCAELYEEDGTDFAAGLNGRFAILVVDRETDELHVVTDRLGSREVYWTRADDGAFVFASNLQVLSADPHVTAAFDERYLAEYFGYRRAFGLRTPLENVQNVSPASVTTVHNSGEFDTEQYWRPVHDPVDKPHSYFVREFRKRFRAAMADRTADDASYGVLLSGGTDSRLLLSGFDDADDVTAYHATGWMSEESRIAERVAHAADTELQVLKRDRDYQAGSLDRNAPLSNFVGAFDEGHVTGFAETLRDEVDLVFTANFADTFFTGHHVPRRGVDVPFVGSFELPLATDVDSVEAFLDQRAVPTPGYFDGPAVRDVFTAETAVGDGIDYHGVEYGSLGDLLLCGGYWPWTNAIPFFQASTDQMIPRRNPFMDNRIVDLHLSMPLKYFFRADTVGAALSEERPELADIPHAGSGVPLDAPFAVQYLGKLATGARRKFLPWYEPPASYLGYGPWPNNSALIREHGFVEARLRANRDRIEALPFLDWEGVVDCYQEHLDGAERKQELFTLLTLLEMPVTERILADERADPPPA